MHSNSETLKLVDTRKGWETSISFTSINNIFMKIHLWKFGKKQFSIYQFEKRQFTNSRILNLKIQKKYFISSLQWKSDSWKCSEIEETLSPVDLHLISEKSILKNQVRRTGFQVYF